MSVIISIDLWGTLIKSSPHFSDAKVALTKKYFDIDMSERFVLECYSKTKRELNDIIDTTGLQPSERVIFNLLFSKLNRGYDSFDFFEKFVFEYQNIAIEKMPEIYSPETIDYLIRLSDLGKLYLSSNTMFINGSSLKKIIFTLGLGQLFERFYFSDQVGESKPSRIMFGHSNFHIGDNALTDGTGAILAHSTPIIINSTPKTIKDAYNIIKQRG